MRWLVGLSFAVLTVLLGASVPAYAQCGPIDTVAHVGLGVSIGVKNKAPTRYSVSAGVRPQVCTVVFEGERLGRVKRLATGTAAFARVAFGGQRPVRVDAVLDAGPLLIWRLARAQPAMMPFARGGLSYERGRKFGVFGGGGVYGQGGTWTANGGAAVALELTHWTHAPEGEVLEWRLDAGLDFGAMLQRAVVNRFFEEHSVSTRPPAAEPGLP